jgi:hypothetical protein
VVFTTNTLASGSGGFAMNDVDGNFTEGLCNVCHDQKGADPGKMVFYTSTSATGDHNETTVCTNCHLHSADTTVNGEAFKGGGCNGCHGYPPGDGSGGDNYMDDGVDQSKGAHITHVDHIMNLGGYGNISSLDAEADVFDHANAKFEDICGACHMGSTHETGAPAASNRDIAVNTTSYQFSTMGDGKPKYDGTPGITNGAGNMKTCSNVNCHFKASPVWESH